MVYVQITDVEEHEALEFPTEDDGTLLVEKLAKMHPGAICLKYRSNNGRVRIVKEVGGKLFPPDGGWIEGTVYSCVFPSGASSKTGEAESSSSSNSKNIQKDEQRNKNPVSIFRVGLQDFIDSKISPIAKYEAAKLMTFAVESFTTFVEDMKEMKDLEKDVISRGLIEIVEERFLGDRWAKENQNLSHEEKMRKVLTLSHPEIREIKKRIKEDSEITEENYPKYSAIAHDHFSSRIHQYIHRKRKIDYHHASEINGVFPGRYLAIRAMKILFRSVCSPTKGLHKKFFTPGRNLASHILEYQSLASSTNPRIPIQIPNPNPVKRHIRFHDDADDRKNDDCKLGKIKHKKRFTHGNFWWNTTDHGWKQSHERPHFTI